MDVETYEVETIDGATYASDEEKQELVELAEKLALTGQKELIGESADGTATVFPYRLMTKAERNVYQTLLPVRTKMCDFKDSVIPLRVMQVAAHAKDLNDERVGYLEVWHQPGARDPVLVGRENSYGDCYILARWGEDLENFQKLQERALKLLKQKAKAWAVAAKAKIDGVANNPEGRVTAFLSGDIDDWKVSFYDC
jgi:hypothetical protein